MMNVMETAFVEQESRPDTHSFPLRKRVKQALESYFDQLEGQTPTQLYSMVLEQFEKPLLETVLQYTRGNQSKAAILLGMSRGTLRKKIKIYNLD